MKDIPLLYSVVVVAVIFTPGEERHSGKTSMEARTDELDFGQNTVPNGAY